MYLKPANERASIRRDANAVRGRQSNASKHLSIDPASPRTLESRKEAMTHRDRLTRCRDAFRSDVAYISTCVLLAADSIGPRLTRSRGRAADGLGAPAWPVVTRKPTLI